jgi:hypothetical protein
MATKAQVENALDVFERDLNKYKNVVGLGIVPAEDENKGGPMDLALAVYVSKKVPVERLAKKDRIPESLTLKKRSGEFLIPVRIIEQGPVEKESL